MNSLSPQGAPSLGLSGSLFPKDQEGGNKVKTRPGHFIFKEITQKLHASLLFIIQCLELSHMTAPSCSLFLGVHIIST